MYEGTEKDATGTAVRPQERPAGRREELIREEWARFMRALCAGCAQLR